MRKYKDSTVFGIIALLLLCGIALFIALPHISPTPPLQIISDDEFMSQIDNIARDREWCGILPEFTEFLESCEKKLVDLPETAEFELYQYFFSEEEFKKFFPMAAPPYEITESGSWIIVYYHMDNGMRMVLDVNDGRVHHLFGYDPINQVSYRFETKLGEPGEMWVEGFDPSRGW